MIHDQTFEFPMVFFFKERGRKKEILLMKEF